MQTKDAIEVTIGGNRVTLTKKSVEDTLQNVEPGPIKKYHVKIGGTEYPVKQVLSIASGIPTAAFISNDAYRILTKLGFKVKV
jgi:hypothetical protein